MAALWSYFSSADTQEKTDNSETMASLILNDGTVYRGKVFGAVKSVSGEVGKQNDWILDVQKSHWSCKPLQEHVKS